MFFQLVKQFWMLCLYKAALSSVGQALCWTLPVFVQQAELWNILPAWHMVRTKKNWEWPPWVHAPLHTDIIAINRDTNLVTLCWALLIISVFWACQGVPKWYVYFLIPTFLFLTNISFNILPSDLTIGFWKPLQNLVWIFLFLCVCSEQLHFVQK